VNVSITIGGICEQDLDLFFLEEIVANTSFRGWLLSKVTGWPTAFSELVSARRSIKYSDGEVDLEFTFQSQSGDLACLFVENKISALFQLDQLPRYQQRASELRESGKFKHVAVALLAPHAYASGSLGTVAMVSYEEVRDWLIAQDSDARMQYKLRLLATAIERQGSGYNRESDAPVSDFWLAYWREAVSRAPELEMRQPRGKPSGSAFVWFQCSDLPDGLNICHKLTKGYVDLHFTALGNHVARLSAALNSLIELGWQVVSANKSAAVRMLVPPLKTALPLPQQELSVRQGLDAALALRAWARLHREQLIRTQQTLMQESP
jgi:hypothetical protein